MNTRIEKARKALSMSRAAFGEKMGVSGDVINNLERGRVEAKEHMVMLICDRFGVNETWLRTGKGEMFQSEVIETDIAKLTVDLLTEPADSFKNRLISALARLSDEQWKVLSEITDEISKKE